MSGAPRIQLEVPPELVTAIASAVVDQLEARGVLASGPPASPWMDVGEAAAYLRCAPQRIYDAVHAGRLMPARDGRRLLFDRATLDNLVRGGGS